MKTYDTFFIDIYFFVLIYKNVMEIKLFYFTSFCLSISHVELDLFIIYLFIYL